MRSKLRMSARSEREYEGVCETIREVIFSFIDSAAAMGDIEFKVRRV